MSTQATFAARKNIDCKHFLAGNCHFGDKCWYKHDKNLLKLNQLSIDDDEIDDTDYEDNYDDEYDPRYAPSVPERKNQHDGYMKLIRNGKLAVLYSPGYGGGFSTWCYKHKVEIATDSRIVKRVLKEEEEEEFNEIKIEDLLKSLGYDESLGYNVNAAKNLQVAWVPVGSLWCVEEEDGNEYVNILTIDISKWNQA